MIKLSIGLDSTLGNYRDLSAAFFGEGSRQVKFFDDKIAESTAGRDEEVIAAESQMLQFLLVMDGVDK